MPRSQAGQRRLSRWKPTSGQQPTAGEISDPNTRTAAHPAAVAVLYCCTRCSISSNLASDQVELSGLEPLTSCMPSGGSTSTRVHTRRSPSLQVLHGPPESAHVAVLPCCTAPIRAEEHPRRPNWRPNQRQPCEKGYRRMPPGAPRYPVKQPWMLTLRHALSLSSTPAQPRKPRQPRPQAARAAPHSGTPPQKPAMINLTKITGIMPMSESCLLAYLCAFLYVARGCPGPSGLRILIGSSPERTGSRGREIPEIHS